MHIVTSTGSLAGGMPKHQLFQDTFQTPVCVFFFFSFLFFHDEVIFLYRVEGRNVAALGSFITPPPPHPHLPAGQRRSPKGALFKPHSLSYFPREIRTPGQTAQTDHCVHKGGLSVAIVYTCSVMCYFSSFIFFFFSSPKTPQRELILDSTKTLNCHCSF